MGKPKSGTNIFVIIFKSLMIYIKNFFPLSRVMLFPVFGQIIGIFLIFYSTYFFREQYLSKVSGENLQQNLLLILLGLLLLVLPGFLIFIKAFWDYMIVMVSLNPMIFDISKKGTFGDFKIYNSSVKLKTNNYVILFLLITFLWLGILIFPFLTFFLGAFINTAFIAPIFLAMVLISVIFSIMLSVNISLAFQIFAFEAISPVEVLKKSCNLMKGNFWRTLSMGIILLFVTTFFIPELFNTFIEKTPFFSYLIQPFEAFANIIFKDNMFQYGHWADLKITPFGIAETMALCTVDVVLTAMMLPWGSACFTLLYKDILDRKK
ncbi:MAG: hypothetical protein WCG23_12840 [bacterium]